MKHIVRRLSSPTPGFFKRLRNIGLAITAVSATIATAPVVLPALVVKIAGYLAIAGGVLSATSQTATEGE